MNTFSIYSEVKAPSYKLDMKPRVQDTVFVAFNTTEQYTPTTIKLIDRIGYETQCLFSLQYNNETFSGFNVIIPTNTRAGLYHLDIDGVITETFEIKPATVNMYFKNTHTYPTEIPFNVVTAQLKSSLIAWQMTPMTTDNLYDDNRGVKYALSTFPWIEYSMTIGTLADSQKIALNALHLWDSTYITVEGYADRMNILINKVEFNDREATITFTER